MGLALPVEVHFADWHRYTFLLKTTGFQRG